MTTGIGEDREELVAPKKPQIPADSFAHRLMLVRAHTGYLTVKDAADRCGLNYGSWSNWERGALPRDLLGVVQKISQGLDIDFDWLLFGGNPRTSAGRRDDTPRYRDADEEVDQKRSDARRPGGVGRPPNVPSGSRRPSFLRKPIPA
jgi:transcriptional regulator with XRE-family HTH domain